MANSHLHSLLLIVLLMLLLFSKLVLSPEKQSLQILMGV